MTVLSANDLTEIAHLIIIGGVVIVGLNGERTKTLVKTLKDTVDTQQKTIEALQSGFEACRQRLSDLEKSIKNK